MPLYSNWRLKVMDMQSRRATTLPTSWRLLVTTGGLLAWTSPGLPLHRWTTAAIPISYEPNRCLILSAVSMLSDNTESQPTFFPLIVPQILSCAQILSDLKTSDFYLFTMRMVLNLILLLLLFMSAQLLDLSGTQLLHLKNTILQQQALLFLELLDFLLAKNHIEQ